MLFDKIKALADKHGISITELSLKMGWSEKSIYGWKKSSPSIDKVQKVADYFSVSLDELMDRKEYWDEYDRNLGEEKLAKLRADVKVAENDDRSKLIAAHIDDNVTEEEMEDIIKYINYIKSLHSK